jgi:hypothetical protein
MSKENIKTSAKNTARSAAIAIFHSFLSRDSESQLRQTDISGEASIST